MRWRDEMFLARRRGGWMCAYLISHLGKKLTDAEAVSVTSLLRQAGHLVIDDKGKVTYHLETT